MLLSVRRPSQAVEMPEAILNIDGLGGPSYRESASSAILENAFQVNRHFT